MDWALEELLQQETYTDHHAQTNNNEKEDYIEALHQLLENHVINSTPEAPSSTSFLPPLLLPPGPRDEEAVEDVPVLLSPPEGYRDPDGDDNDEHVEDEQKSSMTAAPTCPGDKQGMSTTYISQVYLVLACALFYCLTFGTVF